GSACRQAAWSLSTLITPGAGSACDDAANGGRDDRGGGRSPLCSGNVHGVDHDAAENGEGGGDEDHAETPRRVRLLLVLALDVTGASHAATSSSSSPAGVGSVRTPATAAWCCSMRPAAYNSRYRYT